MSASSWVIVILLVLLFVGVLILQKFHKDLKELRLDKRKAEALAKQSADRIEELLDKLKENKAKRDKLKEKEKELDKEISELTDEGKILNIEKASSLDNFVFTKKSEGS